MPELPDLEVVKNVLNLKIIGKQIKNIDVLQPMVLHCLIDDVKARLIGSSFHRVDRRGKFLIFNLDYGTKLVMHLMLGGRLRLANSKDKVLKRTCFRIYFYDGMELRYLDPQQMGRVYLVRNDDFSTVPQFPDLGPEAVDPSLTFGVFSQRIRKFRGMIKNVLTNQKFLAGIGNAYADEILFEAGILPFRQRSGLKLEELEKLFGATQSVLSQAMESIADGIGEDIHVELRDFLRVHGRGGLPCSVCGGKISQISPNKKITSFCRNCQQ
ncbi:Fpg/Nei family DNA glycosylase [candidate division KSB1 bacterium]|nr:Fpg/Nei family DNA glycosylase [candidate division KSB1 bacterium]